MSSLSLTRKTQFKMYQKWYFGSLFRWKCFMNENPKANPTPNWTAAPEPLILISRFTVTTADALCDCKAENKNGNGGGTFRHFTTFDTFLVVRCFGTDSKWKRANISLWQWIKEQAWDLMIEYERMGTRNGECNYPIWHIKLPDNNNNINSQNIGKIVWIFALRGVVCTLHTFILNSMNYLTKRITHELLNSTTTRRLNPKLNKYAAKETEKNMSPH